MEGWAPGSILPSRSLWGPQGHCDDLGHAQEKKILEKKKKKKWLLQNFVMQSFSSHIPLTIVFQGFY